MAFQIKMICSIMETKPGTYQGIDINGAKKWLYLLIHVSEYLYL